MHLISRMLSAALLLSTFSIAPAQTPSKPNQPAKSTPSATTQTSTASKATAAQKANESTDKLDINTASVEQLKTLPGIGDAYAAKIVRGRPYAAKNQLTTKGILPQPTYEKIKEQIIAHRVQKN